MAEIKSALELALEKAESYGRASKEEMAQLQHQEQGRQLAVQFFKEAGDLAAELGKLPAAAQTAARQAAKEVFLRNIGFPRAEGVDDRLGRALDGLLRAAANPKAMLRLKAELEQLLQQYQQIRQNASQQLKARFAGGMNQLQRAMEAQTGSRVRLEPEQLPQYQEEWRRFLGSLQEQFDPMLEGLKERMRQA